MSSRIYGDLALKDVFRLWSASQLQVIIIAGICLPILLLLGLKNGHVADLREDLVTSPTGRQIVFWSAMQGEFLTEPVIDDIQSVIPKVALIIPESQKLVFARRKTDEESSAPPLPLTLYSTLPGDPILKQFDADIGVTVQNPPPLVLSGPTARTLNLRKGDTTSVSIKRRMGNEEQEHTLAFSVIGTVASGNESDGLVGFAHLDVMASLEKYAAGEAVPDFSVPAMESLRAVDQYTEMLLICFRGPGTDLTEKDHAFLAERGLIAEETNSDDITSLYGVLKPEAAKELRFYFLRFSGEHESPHSVIRDNPELLARNTEAQDDLVLRWCAPRTVKVNGQDYRLVGLTLPNKRQNGGWIQNFLHAGAPWFTYKESTETPLLVRGSAAVREVLGGGEVSFGNDVRAVLEPCAPLPSDDKQSGAPSLEDEEVAVGDATTAFVPTSLLAFLNQAARKQVTLDSEGRKFVPASQPVSFTKARMYTDTIDDVPLAADMLAKRKYAVLSEVGRIAEIQEQDTSLKVLVAVVALGVFLFGIITVFSVLVDSTDRKKGMIGILRVMGISSGGVFLILLARAVIIGVMAAGLCCGIGVFLAAALGKTILGAEYLSWLPQVRVVLGLNEYLLVTLGAILCAGLGVLMPALKASRLDPFDAIMEGQFH
ncbi:MAG: FtsX-like permease family protein [Proteobacteria bacterium]|nr:FtsX-like permease family protein [Pseudomonadota bacterium]